MRALRTRDPADAVAALRAGQIVAYPTEAVYGFGCDPHQALAVAALIALKSRDPLQGLLLIAACYAQVEQYIDHTRIDAAALAAVRASWPGPQTWLLPASTAVPAAIRGRFDSVGLRVTVHADAASLCRAFGGAIVSTSANFHGDVPARSASEAMDRFDTSVAVVLEGNAGGLSRPTPIYDALSGAQVRA